MGGLGRRGHFRGMAVSRAEQQRQQQDARKQAFAGMFDDEGWNTHGAISLRQKPQIGGLPLSAPENALTIRRTRNTTNNSLAMEAARPARPKKPI